MQLAFVIFRYFPFGGLQRDMLALAQAAHMRGHQATIFCGAWQGDKIAGINVVEINASGFFNIAGVKMFVDVFRQQFQREQFDLLVGFNKMPGLDVYFAGDSCFAHKAYRERSFLYRMAPRSRLYLAYEHSVFSPASATQILSLVASEQKQFARYYATPAERFHFLPPGISLAHLACVDPIAARSALEHELGLSVDTRIIMCLGSGYKTKGVDISIAAFAELTTLTEQRLALVIVGKDDPYLYRKQAQQAGIDDQVFFLGPRSPVGDLLHAADLLLHPARKELGGNVLLEAMLCACPVVASHHCGYAPYIVDQQMGALIPVRASAQQIAQLILPLLSVDQSVWRARAEHFAHTSDVFSRPAVAVAALEQCAQQKNITLAVDQKSTINTAATIIVRDEFVGVCNESSIFDWAENLSGVVARELPDRQTLRFEVNGQGYYRKWHRGVGWKEIIKNLLQLRLPVIGAQNEWDALNKLQALQIPSLQAVAFGKRGTNPAAQQSFIVTRELPAVIQLDHFFAQRSVDIKTKRRILARVAAIARELHSAGINHRDFYLCHFMLQEASLAAAVPDIYIIDLHRAQLRMQVPVRWLIKDLSGLLFSAFDLGFSRRDYLFFVREYFACDLHVVLSTHRSLLQKIMTRARKTYRRDFSHEPQGVKE